jgi:hypothetical protein
VASGQLIFIPNEILFCYPERRRQPNAVESPLSPLKSSLP